MIHHVGRYTHPVERYAPQVYLRVERQRVAFGREVDERSRSWVHARQHERNEVVHFDLRVREGRSTNLG